MPVLEPVLNFVFVPAANENQQTQGPVRVKDVCESLIVPLILISPSVHTLHML